MDNSRELLIVECVKSNCKHNITARVMGRASLGIYLLSRQEKCSSIVKKAGVIHKMAFSRQMTIMMKTPRSRTLLLDYISS